MIDFRDVKQWLIGQYEVVRAQLNGTTVWEKNTYDEYLWLEYAAGTTQIIAANPTDVTQADILASIDEIIVNDTPITVAATTSALSAGDIVRFKFKTKNNVPASAFQGCNVTRILHWPDTGNPVSIGTFSGTPSAANQPFGRTFEDCNNLISIADAVDGFSNIANNSFWSGSRSGSLMGELTLVPAATEIGKIIIGFAGTSAEHFRFNYNATNIPDTGRDNWYKYYPWNGGGWTYTGTTQYVDMYIGDNVTFIPCYLFMNDINVYIKNSTPPTISSNVGDSCTIHVPSALLSTYQAAWPDLASKMVGDYVV